MHISRKTYKGLVDKKSILMLLILEFLKESRLPKTKMEIRKHLLEEPENLVLTPDKGTDANSVDNYLKALELKGLTVRKRKKGSAILWSLTEELKNQEAIEFKGESLAILRGLTKMLKPYSYLPFFEDLNEWIENNQSHLKVYEEKNNNNNIIVDFDAVRDFTGDGIISFLYDSINDQTAVTFNYNKFPQGNTKEKKVTEFSNFHPYMLKEHGKRWYLIGYLENYGNFLTLGLDRIFDLDSNEGEKFERIEFDPDSTWKHSMGIYTRWEDNNKEWHSHPEKVTFKVKNGERYNNIDYLVSDPLHPSQKPKRVTTDMFDKNDYVQFSLNVFIDTDLVRKLRSIGSHNLKDITPKFLEEWVKEL